MNRYNQPTTHPTNQQTNKQTNLAEYEVVVSAYYLDSQSFGDILATNLFLLSIWPFLLNLRNIFGCPVL